MAKKYIVGLDAGHGEMAAWIVSLANDTVIDPDGESLRLKATNVVNERVIPSVVYYTHEGKYTLEKSVGCTIIGKMKRRFSSLRNKPEIMEAYKAFIKLVVEALVKQNSSLLTLKDKNGEPNFYLCMASPTQWDDKDKNEYLQFFNEAVADLGISFEWIINESDAAFFSHKKVVNHKEVTLVIDYGSSTIDYTVMYQGKKMSEDEWSNDQLGAGNIEAVILDSYRASDYEGYQYSYNGSYKLLKDTGNSHIDIDKLLDYQCRMVKEISYTHSQDNAAIEFHLGDYTGLNTQFRKYRFEYDFSMSEITEAYREAVRLDVEGLKKKIENKIGRKVDKVILSGGACIMNWVGKMALEIFPGAKIIDDRNPSFVVARGIALYAQAQQRALDEILNTVEQMDFAAVYRNADTQATKDAISELSKKAVEEVRTKDTCIKMVDSFGEYIRSLNNENTQYVTLVQNKVCESVTQKVREALKNAFSRHFNWDIDVSSVNIDVDVDCMPWNDTLFDYAVQGQDVTLEKTGIWSQTIMVAIKNILERHTLWLTGVNWTKDRNSDERKYLADELVKEVIKEFDWADSITYGGEDNSFLNAQAKAIKEQALGYATKIFYEKQLFRTTFAK